jgi:hypothetical protein
MDSGISQVLKSLSPLQLGLIVAGVVRRRRSPLQLVAGTSVRRRIAATFATGRRDRTARRRSMQRVEPTLRADARAHRWWLQAGSGFPARTATARADWEPPIDDRARTVSVASADESRRPRQWRGRWMAMRADTPA